MNRLRVLQYLFGLRFSLADALAIGAIAAAAAAHDWKMIPWYVLTFFAVNYCAKVVIKIEEIVTSPSAAPDAAQTCVQAAATEGAHDGR